MKLFLKIILGLIGVIAFAIIIGYVYINNFLPNVKEAPDLKVEATTEMIKRGEYLANHVNMCMDCHAERDWRYFAGPPKEGTQGSGGDVFNEAMGLPGTFYSKNITPAGLSEWTDGEIYRAITVGVDKFGEPLFPIMPYPYYGKMAPEDIKSLIAYIRSLAPIEKSIKKRSIKFPMNLIVRTIPNDVNPPKIPSRDNIFEYGKYLANAAACVECHTPFEKGQIKKDSLFSGNREFIWPTGAIVRTANLTPDNETGIGMWTEKQFINKFKQYLEPVNQGDSLSINQEMKWKKIPVKPDEFNTPMPWLMYAGMTESDLKAIFHYLKSQKPIKNNIVKFTPAKK